MENWSDKTNEWLRNMIGATLTDLAVVHGSANLPYRNAALLDRQLLYLMAELASREPDND